MGTKKQKLPPHVHKIIQDMKRAQKQRLLERIKAGKCNAVLHHGPGHQSSTFCERIDKHNVHVCTYGSFDQRMSWRGKEAFTGYFDEPKERRERKDDV